MLERIVNRVDIGPPLVEFVSQRVVIPAMFEELVSEED
jgi:hypothetical protein